MPLVLYEFKILFVRNSAIVFLVLIGLQLLAPLKEAAAMLLYPPNATSFGINFSVSVPVTEFFPERRILIDWCFAIGYSLPSALSQFYNVPIWPKSPKRDLQSRNLVEPAEALLNYPSYSHIYEKYDKLQGSQHKRHPNDFTAGELYRSIEDILISYGFHETCLLRTVCELAKHPFDDTETNLLTYVLTFLLTPSQHEAFGASESLYREVYEEAEQRGFFGGNCSSLYSDCKKDILGILTYVVSLE